MSIHFDNENEILKKIRPSMGIWHQVENCNGKIEKKKWISFPKYKVLVVEKQSHLVRETTSRFQVGFGTWKICIGRPRQKFSRSCHLTQKFQQLYLHEIIKLYAGFFAHCHLFFFFFFHLCFNSKNFINIARKMMPLLRYLNDTVKYYQVVNVFTRVTVAISDKIGISLPSAFKVWKQQLLTIFTDGSVYQRYRAQN